MKQFPMATAGDEALRYVFPSKQRAAQKAIELAKQNPQIQRLCVFGSAVTADCGMTSDLDLAIIAPSVSGEGFCRLGRPFFREIDSEVDVVRYNRIRSASLKKEIDEKGVCVYDAEEGNAMNEYKDKNILILGLARSGLAAVKLLLQLGAKITVTESKPLDQIKELPWLRENGVEVCGQEPEVFERDYDEVIKNPGINGKLWFVRRLRERGIPVTTEIELAFKVCAPQHFIAITGTNGKTTTTTLLYEVLNRAFPGRAHLSGNIGIALCETVLEQDLMNDPGHYIVLEISNFQLLDIITFRPEIAVIINLAADHLDFMGTEDAYYRSKARVYENMRDNDVFLKNIDDPLVQWYTELLPVRCKEVAYSLTDPTADFYADDEYIYHNGEKLFPLSVMKIVGRHNVQNVLVAVAAATALGESTEDIREAVAAFKGVEHRLEFVRELNGVKYYNDSKGTNVDATVTALRSFDGPVILLAGGHEKGLDLSPIQPLLKNVRQVIGYGECGPRIVKDLTDGAGVLTDDLPHALEEAVRIAQPGDVVLLSPTTSSYDQYSCFEERGEHFKSLVGDLKDER